MVSGHISRNQHPAPNFSALYWLVLHAETCTTGILQEDYIKCRRPYKLQGMEMTRIFHECEVLIENSVPRVTVWHHEAEPRDAKLYPSDAKLYPRVPNTQDRLFFLLAYWRRHMNKNQIYLEVFCIRVSHFDFDVIL